MTQLRPMLAAQKYREAGDLWGPLHEKVVQAHLDADEHLIMQPKIDGMRCMFNQGVPRSRSWKPLANQALQQFAAEYATELQNLDGEVVPGHVYGAGSFREAMSDIRSAGGSNAFTFFAFDMFGNSLGYEARRELLEKHIEQYGGVISSPKFNAKIVLCPQKLVFSLEDIYEEEARLLAEGWEGGIIRRRDTPYKFGRSTALGGALVKVKRRNTVDAIVTGYEQRYENQNEAKVSELGYTTRSQHKDGKVPLEMVGALHLRLLDGSNTETKCGVFRGLGHDDLRALWKERETLSGRHCEVSVDSATGGYDSSRCPVWLRWRNASEF
jgi:DNA ligase-1